MKKQPAKPPRKHMHAFRLAPDVVAWLRTRDDKTAAVEMACRRMMKSLERRRK